MIVNITDNQLRDEKKVIILKQGKNIDLTDLILKVQEESKNEEEEKRTIICRKCRNVITFPQNIMTIEGSHSHVFTNPAGISFQIGCFSEAPGCYNSGPVTDEFTWFSGFSWCFAICAGCFNHLGWFYTRSDSFFYGLILDNLAENRVNF